MSTLTTELDHFVQNHTLKGRNTIETERKIASVLAERELDRNIAEARAQIARGEGVEVTDEWIEDFIGNLAKELLPNQKNV